MTTMPEKKIQGQNEHGKDCEDFGNHCRPIEREISRHPTNLGRTLMHPALVPDAFASGSDSRIWLTRDSGILLESACGMQWIALWRSIRRHADDQRDRPAGGR
jgi:hypothetical protein